MLRRVDLKKSWRSLDQGFWPDDLPLGCQTVIYGHNGSGKSTLSELLLQLADGAPTTSIVWEHENKKQTTVGPGDTTSPAAMSVFTRKWVKENLTAFLDGASASAIVTLGRDAIDAKEEEARLADEIKTLQDDLQKSEQQQEVAADSVDKLARDVQDRIVSELKEFDYNHYTKSRFSLPKVKEDLRKYKGEFPDSNAHAEALKRLGEGAPDPVPALAAPPAGAADSLAGLATLLADTPTRVAIQTLEANPSAQTWVEQGIKLHKELDHCLFCAGELGSLRRDQLAQHFDESWLRIRSDAKSLMSLVTREKQDLVAWRSSLPAATSLASELQSVYSEALKHAEADTAERLATLEDIETALEAKVADPSTTPDTPDWSVVSAALSTEVLSQPIVEHNDRVHRHQEVTADRERIVLDHLIGSQSDSFRQLEASEKECSDKKRSNMHAVREAKVGSPDPGVGGVGAGVGGVTG